MAKSRKKAVTAEAPTETAPHPVEPSAPDVFDQQIEARKHEATQQTAAAVVQEVAESTRLPADVERHGHASQHEHGNGHAARHHQHREHGSHAEAVGKRPHYTGQGKTDLVVGAQLDEHQHPYFSIIRFKEKPSDRVRDSLKQAEFEWRQENEEWRRPIKFETRVQDRLHAERTFEEACKMVREDRGINHGYGSPE